MKDIARTVFESLIKTNMLLDAVRSTVSMRVKVRRHHRDSRLGGGGRGEGWGAVEGGSGVGVTRGSALC